jgi:DHA2 family multidrug resistance protein
MVLFRLLQGFAGAAMMPVSQAFVLDLWRQEVMPRVMAVWSAIIMVGPIIGPTLGGVLTENSSWRWVFYINVPIGVLGFVLVYLFVPRDGAQRARPFDVLGFTALVLFTGALQLVADRGPTLDWFDSREICIEAIVAVCAFYVFVMQSLTAEHPFFHRALLADRNYTSSMIFMFFVAGMLFSTTALLPSFMQTLLGYTALQSGMVSMYRGLGSLAAFAIVTELSRRLGARTTIVMGLVVAASSMWRMSQFDLSMTATPIKLAGLVQGFGMGLMFGPLSTVSFVTLPAEQRTEAAVFGNIVRSLSGSLGIAILQAVVVRQSAAAHEGLAAHIAPSDPLIRWTLPHVFDAPGGMEALNAEVTRQGAMIGYDAIFAGLAVLSLLMVPLILIMRPAKPAADGLLDAHGD